VLLVEPQRILSPARTTWLDRHLDRLCRLLELTPAQFEDAERKYRAVGNWLSDSGSLLAIYAPEIYPQGSMLLGTTVRPQGRLEYDLDLVCQLHWCANRPPLTIYDWVHRRGQLCQRLAELAHLDQRGGGIVSEVPLGERAKPDYLRVMCRQEGEIRGNRPFRHSGGITRTCTVRWFGRNFISAQIPGGCVPNDTGLSAGQLSRNP
jgi:hypothetical protein